MVFSVIFMVIFLALVVVLWVGLMTLDWSVGSSRLRFRTGFLEIIPEILGSSSLIEAFQGIFNSFAIDFFNTIFEITGFCCLSDLGVPLDNTLIDLVSSVCFLETLFSKIGLSTIVESYKTSPMHLMKLTFLPSPRLEFS